MRLINNLYKIFTFTFVFYCFVQTAIAGEDPLPIDEAFVLSSSTNSSGSIVFSWNIAEGYYLYQNRVSFDLPAAVFIKNRVDSKTDTKIDPSFGEVQVFHNSAEILLKLGGQEAKESFDIVVSYQGCWEGGVCYPPTSKTISFQGPIGNQLSPDIEKSPSNSNADSLNEQDLYASTLKNASFFRLLGIFFLAGLALSLTPCVFPMIPILSGIIAGQSGQMNSKNGFLLSLVYVLSMAITYTVAGIFAGLFGANLQAAFQAPAFIILFVAIFILLALSMFGFYNLQLPAGMQSWLVKRSNSQTGGTYTGVALMGFLSALIVGPCMAAPLAGALIYIGQTGDPIMGGLALFSLSIGMGVPLILIGTSAAKYMPKAGSWMENVKHGFGVILLLMAIWMLDRVVSAEVTLALAAIVLTSAAIYMGALNSTASDASGLTKAVRSAAVIILIYAISLIIGLLAGNPSFTTPLKIFAATSAVSDNPNVTKITVVNMEGLNRELAQAKANQQPAVLDFYADWCVSCKEIDLVTLADPRVKENLKGVRFLTVDVTANNEASKQLLSKYEVLGPPTMIFVDRLGAVKPDVTLIGVPSPDEFLTSLSVVNNY